MHRAPAPKGHAYVAGLPFLSSGEHRAGRARGRRPLPSPGYEGRAAGRAGRVSCL